MEPHDRDTGMSSERDPGGDGRAVAIEAVQTEDAPRPPGRVARLPLTEQVAGAIRDMIVQDELQPGERIREARLAERLNVSRTPLREALKVLATEGLVELLPHRGAVVSNPTDKEVRDLLRLIGALEALAGELAAVAASDDQIAEIRALHHEMLAAYARQNRLDYFKLNQKIHLGLIAASRNAALIETHGRINARLYRVRYRSNLRAPKWHTAIEQHEAILAALEARSPETLSSLLRAHFENTWAKICEIGDFGDDSGAEV